MLKRTRDPRFSFLDRARGARCFDVKPSNISDQIDQIRSLSLSFGKTVVRCQLQISCKSASLRNQMKIATLRKRKKSLGHLSRWILLAALLPFPSFVGLFPRGEKLRFVAFPRRAIEAGGVVFGTSVALILGLLTRILCRKDVFQILFFPKLRKVSTIFLETFQKHLCSGS